MTDRMFFDRLDKSSLLGVHSAHQENPSVLVQGCANLSVLADLAGLGLARIIFCKYGKCNHQVQQVQYETQVMQVHQ